jgi:hypothetical protein
MKKELLFVEMNSSFGEVTRRQLSYCSNDSIIQKNERLSSKKYNIAYKLEF